MSHATIADLATQVGFDLPARYNASRLLWDNLPDRSDRPAIHADSGTWTYGALAQRAARMGLALLEGGARPGDRVLIFMEDEPSYPAAVMGAMRAGLVPVLLNTLSPPDLVRFFMEDSGAVAAVVSRRYEALFDEPARAGTGCAQVLWADAIPDEGAEELPEAPTGRDDPAFWMYSSGSTGRPKGVVHRHEDAAYTAQTYARHILRLGPDDICFSVPKLFFAYGFGNSVTFPFAVGASAVLMAGRPDPAEIFGQISRHRPTVFFGLPTLYTALARSDAAADLSSVRLCLSAAEVLSAEIADRWQARFGLEIVEGLGSTEMLHIYLSNLPGDRRPGAAGKVVPGYEVLLAAPDSGAPVAQAGGGDDGVMWVRGLSMARSYWKRPDKTAETMVDGWLCTGDRFTRDADGFHFFKGRADDLVKVSGQWVWPMEIELALNEHPAVRESCVAAVGLPDGRMTVVAWVVAVEQAEDLADRLKAHAKAVLLPHKYPREIRFVPDLPKTGTDKIDRQALLRGEVSAG